MADEEGGRGVSTALIVAGGIGCLVLGVLLIGGMLFMRASHVSIPPPSAAPALPCWQEVEKTGAPGLPGATIVRGPIDGSGRELRAYWKEGGALDEDRSGAYAGAARERALTPDEIGVLRGIGR